MKTFIAFILTAAFFGGAAWLSAYSHKAFGAVILLIAFVVIWSMIRDALK